MKERVAEVPIRLSIWDRAGIWLSGICMVHCLALPLLLVTLPLWPALAPAHDWIHPIFAALLIITTLPAAYAAWRRHASPQIARLLLSGLGIVMVAMILGEFRGVYVEDGATLIGSALLIAGHWKNGRACARGTCHHH